MTEPQVTISGPAQLRHIAKQRGLPLLSKELNQLAALWEQDLIPTALEANWHRIADERAAENVELRAALEIAQAKADLIGGEVCAEARAVGRGPCGCCAWCVKQAEQRAERAEARADELGRRLASKTMALQEAEESVDRLQATKKDLTAEIKGLYAEREAFHESFRRSYDEETKKLHAALERARARETRRAASARNVAEWVRGLWADYCRQSGEAGVSVIMNQEIVEKLKRARALLGKLSDGLDDYWTFVNPEVVAELAAALAEGGRP